MKRWNLVGTPGYYPQPLPQAGPSLRTEGVPVPATTPTVAAPRIPARRWLLLFVIPLLFGCASRPEPELVSGSLPASQVVGTDGADTLQGSRLSFSADDNGVRINDAQVVTADISASNGVIHVIDSVLLPQ